eukprot:TRINITY_DN5397_c0_g1_i1.p1 TRINITY_DN5397_c0_g1~~TRINITY_DN5397_c0_g1_i1.p1  ORF type:complete len:263 (-),score=50.74 TRINITY_DN5397_c0_g1_i1:75-830(-)
MRREHGSKPGSGGVASASQTNADRRERLRKLALETNDLSKDPYYMKNHLGSYECKLCLTLHNNEGSYLAHTQGRRHRQNLGRRAQKEQRENLNPQPLAAALQPTQPLQRVKKTVKIGTPGYKVVKERINNQLALLFTIEYPEIEDGITPRYRFMSWLEQKVEPGDKRYQYLLFAADPYETIAFKIPNRPIESNIGPEVPGESKFWTRWAEDTNTFSLQLYFKEDETKQEQPNDAMGEENDVTSNYAYFARG